MKVICVNALSVCTAVSSRPFFYEPAERPSPENNADREGSVSVLENGGDLHLLCVTHCDQGFGTDDFV